MLLHVLRLDHFRNIDRNRDYFFFCLYKKCFELGKELRKMFFVLSRAWDKEKILSPHEESNLRPSDSALKHCRLISTSKTSIKMNIVVRDRCVIH